MACTDRNNHGAHGLVNSRVYTLTLRASNGMEQSMAAFIPNDDIRRHYVHKAHQAGLEIEIKNIGNN